jgi:hypothetical protein
VSVVSCTLPIVKTLVCTSATSVTNEHERSQRAIKHVQSQRLAQRAGISWTLHVCEHLWQTRGGKPARVSLRGGGPGVKKGRSWSQAHLVKQTPRHLMEALRKIFVTSSVCVGVDVWVDVLLSALQVIQEEAPLPFFFLE